MHNEVKIDFRKSAWTILIRFVDNNKYNVRILENFVCVIDEDIEMNNFDDAEAKAKEMLKEYLLKLKMNIDDVLNELSDRVKYKIDHDKKNIYDV